MTLTVDAAIAEFDPALPLAVAFSGGADSCALLKACVERWPGAVRAIHVHHGLQEAADGFERHCRDCCEQWHVPLAVAHVDARHRVGESPEAAARNVRYRALLKEAQHMSPGAPVRTIALAHHADDQIETLMLALSRGAGLPGLAGMAPSWHREGMAWERPLLAVARADIEVWLRQRGVEWVDDPTNLDTRYTRNRIREHVLPALAILTPAWRDTLARSARHAAQAQALLDEIAREDLLALGSSPQIRLLRQYSRPRLANVLRAWLRQCGAWASTAQLEALMHQLLACATRGHRIHLKVGAGHVVREGEVLHWLPSPGAGSGLDATRRR